MVTSAQEYYDNLWRIKSVNPPSLAVLLPGEEKVYEINLNTRTVEAPEYLSVEQDHRAEIVYFVVDRYYEHYDLTNTICIIQFLNKNSQKSGIYVVPYYDIHSKSTKDSAKIIFPWCIEGLATDQAGDVEYSIRFFSIGNDNKVEYSLNTIPVTSKVLYGLNANLEDYKRPAIDAYTELINLINTVDQKTKLCWDIM